MSTRTARRRLWLLGASALAALAVVAILVVVSQSGGGGGGGSSKPQTTHLFDGIPQHGATLGDPKAAVKMVEFVDLQCPTAPSTPATSCPLSSSATSAT